MKTFKVNVAITVFASVLVPGRNKADAEARAEKQEFDFGDLKLMQGQSKPDMVFQGETEEVHL